MILEGGVERTAQQSAAASPTRRKSCEFVAPAEARRSLRSCVEPLSLHPKQLHSDASITGEFPESGLVCFTLECLLTYNMNKYRQEPATLGAYLYQTVGPD